MVATAKSASTGGKKENLIIPPTVTPIVKTKTPAATNKNEIGFETDIFNIGL